MKKRFVATLALTGLLLAMAPARATTVNFIFGGPGVSGSLVLTYGSATDAKYPNAYEVTSVSGTFNDTAAGIHNAPVLGLRPVTNAIPDATNLLAPNDFSRFAVGSGLPPVSNGFLTFDNLYWPGGSPQTASDYEGAGGYLDIYGLMLDLGGGKYADVWSNGSIHGSPLDYGVAVANSDLLLDYVPNGVLVPEPSSLALLGGGLLWVMGRRRRTREYRPGR